MVEKSSFILDEYIITYDSNMKISTFNTEWYYGIIFNIGNDKYELIHNYLLGNRLFINNNEGWNDIPFKPATFHFLPNGVEAKEICISQT